MLLKSILLFILIPFFTFSQTEFEKARLFYQRSEFDSALTHLSELIKSSKGGTADTTLALYKTYLGKTYSMLEQYEKSLTAFEQAISGMELGGNYNGKAYAMISLAEMYRRSYKLNKAKTEIREVLTMHQKRQLSKNNEAYLYNRFAAIVDELSANPDSVRMFSNKALELVRETGDPDLKASSLNELGFLEEKRKSYDLATKYYKEAYAIYKAQNNTIYIAQMLTNLSHVSLINGKYAEGEAYLKQGIELLKNTNWYNTKAALYGTYSKFLYDQGRYKESTEYMGKFVDVQTAKLEKQQTRALLELESKYELSKKAAQIELEQQKSKLASHEAEKKTQERNYIAVSVVILLILLVLLFLSYKKIKKTNASLSVALTDRELLLKEVNHRVKNNLQVISSLLELQAEHTPEESSKTKLLEGRNRINSIAHVHELIYSQDSFVSLGMKEYITLLSNQVKDILWKDAEGNVTISCENVDLGITEAIPVGILINELLTNSFKHAKPAGGSMQITIELQANNNQISLFYSDNGQLDRMASKEREGIGTTVIKGMVRQLHATSEVYFKNGFQFKMVFEPQDHGKDSYR